MSSRQPTGYTEFLRFSMRPETAKAVEAISDSTGYSRAHVARLAVEQFVIELGLVAPTELTPTVYTTNHQTRGDV